MSFIRKMEKWRNRKLICLIEKKNERLEKLSYYKFIIIFLLNKTKKVTHFFSCVCASEKKKNSGA